jgi:hypothetical protein
MELDSKDLAPRARRFEIRIPVRYRLSGTEEWRDGRTENISRSGVLFRTDHLMPPQTPIEVLMALPAEVGGRGAATVLWRGRTVRTEPPRPEDPRPAVAAAIAGYRLTSRGHDPNEGNVRDRDPRRI